MDCKACRNEIEEAAPGARVAAGALAHLASCERCRAFREERLALIELVSSLGTVAAPHDFDWRLRARLASEKRSYRYRLWPGVAPGTPAIALAASFALLIGVAVLLKQADNRLIATPPQELAAVTSVAEDPDDDLNGSSKAAGAFAYGAGTTAAPQASTGNSPLRGAPRPPRSKGSRGEARATAPTEARRFPPSRSNDFSSSAAPVVTLFSVPVSSPSQPVKVLLDEGRGVMRTVSLQPVTFGSQEIFGRRVVSRRPTPGTEEIW
ncbi:MAG TPA: hypothetical protein VE842_19785 [Pyrinomonadaceae bacterium]|nr:hypothetical protein [Pyrinomonadaceae bacterium]